MNTSDNSPDDRLMTVLRPTQAGPVNDDLRVALRDRTTRLLRGRRRLRQGAMAAALAACYLAGVATALAWWQARPVSPAANHEGPIVAAAPAPDEVSPEPRAVSPEALGPTVRLTPFEQYRRAGDRFLQEPAQLALAVRSYTKALGVASAAERTPSPEQDTWLLLALKDARSKETSHGNVD